MLGNIIFLKKYESMSLPNFIFVFQNISKMHKKIKKKTFLTSMKYKLQASDILYALLSKKMFSSSSFLSKKCFNFLQITYIFQYCDMWYLQNYPKFNSVKFFNENLKNKSFNKSEYSVLQKWCNFNRKI